MTSQEQQLVAALLRCAAASNLHEVLGELGPAGRLTNAAWEAFYRARSDVAAAASALDASVDIDALRTGLRDAIGIARLVALTGYVAADDAARLVELEGMVGR